jgi:hypothetical protein
MFVHDGETTKLVCGEEGRKIIAIVTNRMGRWWRDEEREATTMIRKMEGCVVSDKQNRSCAL